MKIRLLTFVAILAILVAGLTPGSALAGAYNTAFITSITYMNIGSAATTTLQILFYGTPSTTTPIVINRPALNPLAGTSVYVGSLTEIAGSFQGTAIMQSDQPLLATLVQIPQGGIVKNRPLSNGFTSGTGTTLLATVLKNTYDYNTVFSVQNVGGAATNATVKFYNTSATLVHTITQNSLAAGAGFYVDAGTVSALGSSFNGSAVIEAAAGGSLISSAMEMSISGNGVSAFEGVGQGALKVYMPSAMCNAFGGYNTSFAVQNTSLTTPTNVTVKYSNGIQETKTVLAGSKQSFPACSAAGMPSNFSGAATLESTATNIVAIGKAYGLGLSSAFLGFAQGAQKQYLPYVRWATDVDYAAGTQQRTFIAIQNIGTSTIAGGQITVKYYGRDGALLGTHTIADALPAGAKTNSNASNAGLTQFGIYVDGWGGSAVVEGPAGSQLAAIGRVSTVIVGGTVGEDYNAIAP